MNDSLLPREAPDMEVRPANPMPAQVTAYGKEKQPLPLLPKAAAALEPKSEEWYNALRILRAEVQDLRMLMASIRNSEASLKGYADYIKNTHEQIETLFNQIDTQTDDRIRRAHNAWEQLKSCPLLLSPEQGFDAQEEIQSINLVDGQCRRIIYWISCWTIPHRLKAWLEETQSGYAIPFHALFEDEILAPEDRQKILNFLACTPRVLLEHGSIVDANRELVYRYDNSRVKCEGSLLLVIGTVLAFSAAVYAGYLGFTREFSELLTLQAWGNPSARVALVGWLAVLVGLIVHVAVGTGQADARTGAGCGSRGAAVQPDICDDQRQARLHPAAHCYGPDRLSHPGLRERGPRVECSGQGYQLDQPVVDRW